MQKIKYSTWSLDGYQKITVLGSNQASGLVAEVMTNHYYRPDARKQKLFQNVFILLFLL